MTDIDYACPFCGEPWPETETILPNGQLGCRCQANAPAVTAGLKRIALMHRRHGVTPGQTCGTCQHLTSQGRNRVYYKCRRYGVSRGSGTDWRKKWIACGLWSGDPSGDRSSDRSDDQTTNDKPVLSPGHNLPD